MLDLHMFLVDFGVAEHANEGFPYEVSGLFDYNRIVFARVRVYGAGAAFIAGDRLNGLIHDSCFC
jgi:hypothetical protein